MQPRMQVKHIRGIGDRKVKQLLAFHASGHVVPDGCECITDVAQLQAALFANPNAALVSQVRAKHACGVSLCDEPAACRASSSRRAFDM